MIARKQTFPSRLGSRRERVLVVAAHPDDDVIGCGGLMSHVSRSGGDVLVLYLTDGSRSHPGSLAFDGAAVAAIRESEAIDALTILGIRRTPEFFRLPDGALHVISPVQRRATVDRIAASIAGFDPDLILAPWRRDPHCDHIAASELAREAITVAGYCGDVAAYEVWLPIRGSLGDRPGTAEVFTVAIELDARSVEEKRRSILAHVSQTTALIHDDPAAFRMTPEMIAVWAQPLERLHFEPFVEAFE